MSSDLEDASPSKSTANFEDEALALPPDHETDLGPDEITARPVLEVGDLLKAVTRAVLASLGADLEVASWTTTSDDTYVIPGPHDRLGPCTKTCHAAVLEGGLKAEAEVTTNIIRWSPGLVSSTSAEGSWRIGDRHAGVVGRAKGDDPILEVSIRAPDAIRNLVLDALRTPSDQKS